MSQINNCIRQYTDNRIRQKMYKCILSLIHLSWEKDETNSSSKYIFRFTSSSNLRIFQNLAKDVSSNDNSISGQRNNWLNTTNLSWLCLDWQNRVVSYTALYPCYMDIALCTIHYTLYTIYYTLYTIYRYTIYTITRMIVIYSWMLIDGCLTKGPK